MIPTELKCETFGTVSTILNIMMISIQETISNIIQNIIIKNGTFQSMLTKVIIINHGYLVYF